MGLGLRVYGFKGLGFKGLLFIGPFRGNIGDTQGPYWDNGK